jgi:hypothetical protein
MNNEAFKNPNRSSKRPDLPPMLERNPDFKEAIVTYAKWNLDKLTAEFFLTYVHDIALPELLKERRKELDNPDFTVEDLLKEN